MSASCAAAPQEARDRDQMDADPDVEAPWTPKRSDQAASDEPPKKLSRSKEREPTNLELLEFVRGWQHKTEGRFAQILERVDETEKRSALLEKAIGCRMDSLEARLENVATATLAATTEKTKKLAEQLQEQRKQLDSVLRAVQRHAEDIRSANKIATEATATAAASSQKAAAAAASAAAARPTPNRSSPTPDSDIVVIGGFKPDTPREGILAVWSTVKDGLRVYLSADMEIDPPLPSRSGVAHQVSWAICIAIFGCSVPPAQSLRHYGECPVQALCLPPEAARHPRPQQAAHEGCR